MKRATLYHNKYLFWWIADDLAALDGEELADEEDYLDISRHGIVEVVGDDSAGRKIIVVSACKLPPIGKETFNHAKLLRWVCDIHVIKMTREIFVPSQTMIYNCPNKLFKEHESSYILHF